VQPEKVKSSMKRSLSNEHLEDAALLAYLDAELSGRAARTVQKHLQICWVCRSAMAELELLTQTASKLFSQQNESDSARTRKTKARFRQVRMMIEERLKERPAERNAFFGPLFGDQSGYDFPARSLAG
jgi:anti-sigma factor RsiW